MGWAKFGDPNSEMKKKYEIIHKNSNAIIRFLSHALISQL